MKLLAFDTSSANCSVALLNDNVIHVKHLHAPMQQARLLLPFIHTLLETCSLKLTQLDAIAYGCGPGSFTGIRIANTVAQGLGFAAQRPLIRLPTMMMLAYAAFLKHGERQCLVALDARVEQIYWATYRMQQSSEPVGEESLCKPSTVNPPPSGDWCGIGDGWDKYFTELTTCVGYAPRLHKQADLPLSQALIELAKIKLEKGESIAAEEAFPLYLR